MYTCHPVVGTVPATVVQSVTVCQSPGRRVPAEYCDVLRCYNNGQYSGIYGTYVVVVPAVHTTVTLFGGTVPATVEKRTIFN